MSLGTLTNPRWFDAGHTAILLSTTWEGAATTYLARPDDSNAAGRTVYAQALAGAYGEVADYALAAPPAPTQDSLRAYAMAKIDGLRATPRAYVLAPGVTVVCDATPATGVDLNGLYVNPTPTAFVQNDGAVVELTADQGSALALAVLGYGRGLFAALAAAMAGIGSGAINTTAQIDALNWPV